jgi:catechol 2,3-dioxygenase-like lactoylglutathione lyase family enzyme/predicted enzyme related to lactoylglutathione lyase
MRVSAAAAFLITVLIVIGAAQAPPAKALPLENLGLEHLDIIVPDPAASARFYSRIFKSALHQQPVRDTLRYFILLGDLPADRQVGYVAIGAAGERMPAIGHYCTLAKVYDRAGVASALQSAGFGVATAGPTGMWPDPDRLELQLFQPPAGLVTAAVPSPRDVVRDGLLTPRGVDHVMLRVTSLEKSLPYYRLVYGPSVERPRDANGRVWLQLARNTRLGLEQAAVGQPPTISHYTIKVASFDRGALETRVREAGGRVLPAPDEPDVVRFADNNGIIVEVRVAE